jgi:hypothetical protein
MIPITIAIAMTILYVFISSWIDEKRDAKTRAELIKEVNDKTREELESELIKAEQAYIECRLLGASMIDSVEHIKRMRCVEYKIQLKELLH